MDFNRLRTLWLSFLITLSFSLQAQEKSGDLEVYLHTFLATAPQESGNQYTPPSANEQAAWQSLMSDLLTDKLTDARLKATDLGYQIVRFLDTAAIHNEPKVFYVLEEMLPSTKHWGISVFNFEACRNRLILQAPHSFYDFNTGKQAAYNFVRLDAFALLLNGCHRCNHSDFSSCDGTTSVCQGSSSAFQVSDLAHNDASIFQVTTGSILEKIPDGDFIQLHGFSKVDNDPYVILSNGTRSTPFNDKISALVNQLSMVDPVLTFKVGHLDLSWDRLLGSTNVQGRLINGSSSACDIEPQVTNGHFIHIEQEKTRLRADETGWEKMRQALAQSFPCDPTSSLDQILVNSTVRVSPNPASQQLVKIESNLTFQHLSLKNQLGQLVWEKHCAPTQFAEIDLTTFRPQIYTLSISGSAGLTLKRLIIL